MAIPRSRKQLVDYCLRALGSPVVEINVSDEQLEDRIDEAISFYQSYHSDAVVRTLLRYELQQADFDRGYFELPDSLIYVSRIMNLGGGYSADFFNQKYQMFANDMFGLKNPGDLINYELSKQYLATMEMSLNGKTQQITFSRHMNRLQIEEDWKSRMAVGEFIIVEGYQTINPDEYTDVYTDQILHKHLTALIKRQWGQNLIKFEGIQLPGGVTLNGRAIYDDAANDIKDIEEEYESKHQYPPDFYTG